MKKHLPLSTILSFRTKRRILTFSLLSFRICAALFASLFVLGCEREIDMDLNSKTPSYVFEGFISNDPGPYEFRITQTTNYFGNDPEPLISGAFFTIRDDAGSLDTLIEISQGIYQTQTIQGVLGNTYTFEATIDGKTFSAIDKLNRINAIDSSTYKYKEDLVFLPDGYYVTSYAQEPAGMGDYYLLRFYKNDSLYNDTYDYFFTDDRFADGVQVYFEYPYELEAGDTVITEIQAISKNYYEFLVSFLQQANGAGSPFGTVPENLLGNVSNEGLGFLGATGITRDTIVIIP